MSSYGFGKSPAERRQEEVAEKQKRLEEISRNNDTVLAKEVGNIIRDILLDYARNYGYESATVVEEGGYKLQQKGLCLISIYLNAGDICDKGYFFYKYPIGIEFGARYVGGDPELLVRVLAEITGYSTRSQRFVETRIVRVRDSIGGIGMHSEACFRDVTEDIYELVYIAIGKRKPSDHPDIVAP